jgi:hypothetical protein
MNLIPIAALNGKIYAKLQILFMEFWNSEYFPNRK